MVTASQTPPAPLLPGKRIFVTAGATDLGRELCQCFAKQEADVAFSFEHDVRSAEQTLAAIAAHGGQALKYQIAALDRAAVEKTTEDLESRWGGVDILVNCIHRMSNDELATDLIDSAVDGIFLATKAFLPGMIRRKQGVVLNVFRLPNTPHAYSAPVHHAASQAAIQGYTNALCLEVARYGIRANCLALATLDARFAAFMVSDRNTYMNGSTITMNATKNGGR